jgi:pilus assembly protein Flp/PilA
MTMPSMLHPHLARLWRAFAADERGATAVEYAMIAASIGAAIAATVWTLGIKVNGLYVGVNNGF